MDWDAVLGGLKRDCRLFRDDRPCAPHKATGVTCPECPHYDPVHRRVLVVKLDAPGDVLRTTAILPALAAALDRPYVVWITRPAAAPLLADHPRIDEVWPLDAALSARLAAQTFDLVLGLDTSPDSAALAALARAAEKRGYALGPGARVGPLNPGARAWYAMGVRDDLKKSNVRTYQELIHEAAGLPPGPGEVALALRAGEIERGARHLAALGVRAGLPVIGVNTGAGGRWRWKRWTEDGIAALAAHAHREGVGQIILLGGPEEAQRNAALAARCPGAIDAGCGHDVRAFAAIVRACDVVVTGDTLALHIACALRRRVVALFGPTSAPEIELYGLGQKIVADVPCVGCYLADCDVRPKCMEVITPERVMDAVVAELKRVPPRGA